jgi:hypothetical protein
MSMIKTDGSSQPVSHQFAKNGLGNIQNINWTFTLYRSRQDQISY